MKTRHMKTKYIKKTDEYTKHIKYKTSNHNISKPNLGCIRVEQILYNVLITKSESFNKKYHKLTESKRKSK